MAGSDDDGRRGKRIAIGVTAGSVAIASILSWSILRIVDGSRAALEQIQEWQAEQLAVMPSYARPLGVGTVVTAADLVDVELPERMVPDEALRSGASAVGRTLIEPVLAGDLVRAERLSSGRGGGLQAIVPQGMRALSLDLDPTSYVEGSVEPGNRVDAIVTLIGERGGRAAETKTVLASAKVLAIDEWMSETAMGEQIPRSRVTLAVYPDDSARMTHAASVATGKVRLALLGELESLLGPAPEPESSPIGREDERMSPAEFRQSFSDADVDEMYRRYYRDDELPEAVVDPLLVRGLAGPVGDGSR